MFDCITLLINTPLTQYNTKPPLFVHWFGGWGSHLIVVRGIPQQPPEGDGVGDAAQVDEEDGRDGLDVNPIVEIAGEPVQLALQIQVQTSTEPETREG